MSGKQKNCPATGHYFFSRRKFGRSEDKGEEPSKTLQSWGKEVSGRDRGGDEARSLRTLQSFPPGGKKVRQREDRRPSGNLSGEITES